MFVIGEVIIEMLIPYLVGILIDNGIMKGDMSYISKMGLLLLVLTVISLILGASASYVSAHAAAGFAANLRQDMFYHMQDYSFENIDHFSSASLVTRLTTDVNNVQMAYQMIIRIAVRAPMMFIVSIIMSIIISPRLSKTAYPYFPKIFRGYDRMNQVVRENVRGIREVKTYVQEQSQIKEFKKSSGFIYKLFATAQKIMSLNALVVAAVWIFQRCQSAGSVQKKWLAVVYKLVN